MRIFGTLPLLFLGGTVLAQFQVMLDGMNPSDFRDVIKVPMDAPAVQMCMPQCVQPFQTIMTCGAGANNAQCFCTPELLSSLTTCEQCMLNYLVATNTRPSDPRIGLNSIITSLQGSCKMANITLPKTALAVAPNWDGPLGVGLSVPGAAIVVGLGTILGSSFLYTLTHIE